MSPFIRLTLTFALVACSGSEPPSEAIEVDASAPVSDVSERSDAHSEATDSVMVTDALAAPSERSDGVSGTSDIEVRAEVGEQGEDALRTLDTEGGPDVSELPADLETAWGVISGACGAATDALQSSGPAFLTGTYTFEDEESFQPGALGAKPLTRFEDDNAGGSSRCTEVMSMQLLIDCEDASVLKTETELVYDVEGKLADYLAEIDGVRVGVSVTRAYKGPSIDVYTLDDARDLLEKKLSGIAEARANVSEADHWDRSMVHVWTLHPAWAETVHEAWESLDGDLKGESVVLVTVEAGSTYIVTDTCHD